MISFSGSSGSEDLQFDYVNDWGPRFTRLAQMYGPQPDEEDDSEFEFPPKNVNKNHNNNNNNNNTINSHLFSPKSKKFSSISSSGSEISENPKSPLKPAITKPSSTAHFVATSGSIPTRSSPNKVPQVSFADPSSSSSDTADALNAAAIIRGEYHEAINPMDEYDEEGIESWC